MRLPRMLPLFLVFSTVFAGLAITPEANAITVTGPTLIGGSNQGLYFGSYASGSLVVVVHAVQASSIAVVEVSTNGGTSFNSPVSTTFAVAAVAATFSLPVAAADATHIVIVDCANNRVIKTTDGVSWAAVGLGWATTAFNCAIAQNGGTYVASGYECLGGNQASCSGAIGQQTMALAVSRSIDTGATWGNLNRLTSHVNSNPSTSSSTTLGRTAIVNMASSTSWTITYSRCLNNNGFPTGATTCQSSVIAQQATTNTGSTYGTQTVATDAFTPGVFTDYGYYLSAGSDSQTLTFRLNPSSNNVVYVGHQQPGVNVWYFAAFDSSTGQLGGMSPTYSCTSVSPRTSLALYQGAPGTEKLRFALSVTNAAGSTVTTTLQGAVATTSTTQTLFTSWTQGSDVYWAWPDPSTNQVSIYKAANACSAAATTGGGSTTNPVLATTLQASVTFPSTTSLIAFAVDPFNQGIIARHADGANSNRIHTYIPTTLALADGGTGFAEANCKLSGGGNVQRSDGVAVTYVNNKVFTSFTDCDSNGYVNTIHIRNGLLGDPDVTGTVCEGDDFCEFDVQTAAGIPCQNYNVVPASLRNMGHFAAIPPSWTYSTTSGRDYNPFSSDGEALLAWTFAAPGDGVTGILFDDQRNDGTDCTAQITHGYLSTANLYVDGFCSWRDTHVDPQIDYYGVSDRSGPTQIYSITDKTTNGGALGGFGADAALTAQTIGNSNIDGSYAIGCGRDRALTLGPNGIAYYFRAQGAATIASYACTSPVSGAAAESLSGFVGAMDCGGFIRLINQTTGAGGAGVGGQIMDSFTAPSSGVQSLWLDSIGQTLYVAAFDGVWKYVVSCAVRDCRAPVGTLFDDNGKPRTQVVDGVTRYYCTDSLGQLDPNCAAVGLVGTGAGTDLDDTTCTGACTVSPSPSATGVQGFLGVDPTKAALEAGMSVESYNFYLGVLLTFAIGVVFGIAGVLLSTIGGGSARKALSLGGGGFLFGCIIGFAWAAMIGFFEVKVILLIVFLAIVSVIGVVALLRRR